MTEIRRENLARLTDPGCGDTACPAIHRVHGTDQLVIIGRVLGPADLAQVPGVGPGETATAGLDIADLRAALARYDAGTGA